LYGEASPLMPRLNNNEPDVLAINASHNVSSRIIMPCAFKLLPTGHHDHCCGLIL
jgi:hypothetical protein